MKKLVTYLLVMIFAFATSISLANAKTYQKDDIKNNSYIIGTHLITTNIELNISVIMYASQTIEGNTESDMIIYYKSPFGVWQDALSGNTELEIPNSFEITHVDLKRIMNVNITFNPNGGTGQMNSQTVDNISDTTLNTNSFTNTGYRFIGWNTKVDGTGDSYTDGQQLNGNFNTANVTLYAIWSPLYGDINADGNIDSSDVTLLKSYLNNSGTLTGYQLKNAHVYNGDDTQVDYKDLYLLERFVAGEFQNTLPNKKIEYQFSTYTVSFGDDAPAQTVAEGLYATRPSDPIKEGYTFFGWKLNNQDFDFDNTRITGPTAITANWVSDSDVNYVVKVTAFENGAWNTDRLLTVYGNDVKFAITEIKYTNGTHLCYAENTKVAYVDVKDETSLTVILANGKTVTATVEFDS